MKKIIKILLPLFLLFSCNSQEENNEKIRENTQNFIDGYTTQYLKFYYESNEAEWKSNTMIIQGDSTNAIATRKANEALARFTGSKENIEKARKFLEKKDKLLPLQIKQLEVILYKAANKPQTVEDLVKQRIKAETEQNEKLFGFDFQIAGKSVSTNDIDEILQSENDLEVRLEAWQASKEVGKTLRQGLTNLRDLRNKTVQALGYHDYFTYQVSEYGMTTEEMMQWMQYMLKELWPLYTELHTYTRYELAQKYGVEQVPDMIPAHWLPNRWGQSWSAIVKVEGIDLDNVLEEKGSEWLVKQAERFYISLGFDPLPESFYEKSSLYPLPETADYKKNNHASAWHLDLENDVRSLMSVIPNSRWYGTTHHELGHIYYYLSYTNPDVPVLLRRGANRAYHEAIGSLMGLAATQEPFMVGLGLMPQDIETDQMMTLLKEALGAIVFIPFSCGVMTGFEHDLYVKDLPENEFNKRWWELKAKYQGIAPPSAERIGNPSFCDAASKTHINNDAAQYYDYAISSILLFQLHDHIAKNILKQDPHATNYYGNKQVGEFLKSIMAPGASADWKALLREKTGEDLSAKAMLDYFEPLMEYLKKENEGRVHTLTPLD
ncbi:MAG: M2 family metallopeptidase [Bacteroidetes bacterium]|nr:M2 family metallopeptidase [Bacteroidota bacterium]